MNLQEKIARGVWDTTIEDFIAEAEFQTPYKTDVNTLNDIAEVCELHYSEKIAKLEKSLAYNAMLSARFMMALNHISQKVVKDVPSGIYASLNEAISVAKEALITPSFETV